jgi:hypothetical protein
MKDEVLPEHRRQDGRGYKDDDVMKRENCGAAREKIQPSMRSLRHCRKFPHPGAAGHDESHPAA